MALGVQRKLLLIRDSHEVSIRQAIFGLCWISVFAVSWILLSPSALYQPATTGLDQSWAIGIQLAVKNGLTFGKDIVFTFGPLGYLATKLPIGVGKGPYVARDVVVMGLTTWMLLYVFWQTRTWWRLFLAFLAILTLSLYLTKYTSLLATFLFMAFVFLLLYDLRRGSLVALLSAAAISVVVFYMKLNPGLPIVAMMLAYLACLFAFSKRHSRQSVLILTAIYIAAIVGASWALDTDLPGYLQGSLYIVSGHNEAMAKSPGAQGAASRYLAMVVILMLAFAWAAIGNIKDASHDWTVWMMHGLAAVFLLATYKHAFTRADAGHVRSFFIFVPTLTGLLLLSAQPEAQIRLSKVFMTALIFSFAVLQPPLTFQYLATRSQELAGYVRSVPEPMDTSVPASLRSSLALPEEVLATIGSEGVDIIPWEIETIYANDLNYHPRPIIHSYDVYNAFLDEKNAAKYLSDDAPAYILYFTGEVDDRYPFSTESLTKLAMLSNYEVLRQFDQYLLLRKRTQPRRLTETEDAPQRAGFGETISLGDGGIQVLEADVDYTPLGSLTAALYQAPPFTVTAVLAGGEELAFRGVKGIVNGGMLVSPFVNQLHHAHLFFDLGQGRKVTGIRLDSPAPWAYQNQFVYRIKHSELEDVPSANRQLPAALTDDLALISGLPRIEQGSLVVDLLWRGDSRVPGADGHTYFTAYAQLLDDQGQRMAGADRLLKPGEESFVAMRQYGDHVYASQHRVQLPTALPPGAYDVLVGIYYLEGGQPVEVASIRLEDLVTAD